MIFFSQVLKSVRGVQKLKKRKTTGGGGVVGVVIFQSIELIRKAAFFSFNINAFFFFSTYSFFSHKCFSLFFPPLSFVP